MKLKQSIISGILLILVLMAIGYNNKPVVIQEVHHEPKKIEIKKEIKAEPEVPELVKDVQGLLSEEYTLFKVYNEPIEQRLTEYEYNILIGIITAESGGYSFTDVMEDRILIAQTIREEIERTGKQPSELTRYADPVNDGVSEQTILAIELVFYEGYGIAENGVRYFYAPKVCHSEFHEGQTFICETKLHRYFN